jgi:small subunit ribosomal protein S2
MGRSNNAMAPVVTMKQLLEAGVHFGHQTRRWNPKMRRFIFGERNGIYIIDLQQTLDRIEAAYSFIRDLVANGGTVLFVGTKKQAQDPIRSYSEKCGMPYVNERWLGGMLTNFETISKRVGKMQEYQRMRDSGEFEAMPKKEALVIGRELEKLERNLQGIRAMEHVPQAVFVLDTKKEHIAVTEANKLGVPLVAVVDTNCDPDLIQYVIPGNDDAIRSGTLMCRIISDAVEEGRFIASRRTGGAGPALSRSAEEDARIAAEQAEARRQAAIAAREREARVAAARQRAVQQAESEATATGAGTTAATAPASESDAASVTAAESEPSSASPAPAAVEVEAAAAASAGPASEVASAPERSGRAPEPEAGPASEVAPEPAVASEPEGAPADSDEPGPSSAPEHPADTGSAAAAEAEPAAASDVPVAPAVAPEPEPAAEAAPEPAAEAAPEPAAEAAPEPAAEPEPPPGSEAREPGASDPIGASEPATEPTAAAPSELASAAAAEAAAEPAATASPDPAATPEPATSGPETTPDRTTPES